MSTSSSNLGQAHATRGRSQIFRPDSRTFAPAVESFRKGSSHIHRSQITFCSACPPTLSWRTPPAQTSSLLSPSSVHRNYRRSHFDQIDRKSGKCNLGQRSFATDWQKVSGITSQRSQPFRGAQTQLRSLAWVSQIQIVQPSAAFHTRTRSEWMPSISFQLGLSAAARFARFRSFPAPALLKSCRALKPTDPTTVRAPYPFRHPSSSPPKSSLASLYIKSYVHYFLLWSSIHHPGHVTSPHLITTRASLRLPVVDCTPSSVF